MPWSVQIADLNVSIFWDEW